MAHIAISVFSFLFIFSAGFANAEPTSLEKIDSWIANNQLETAKKEVESELAKSSVSASLLVRHSRIVSLMGEASSNEKEKVALFEKAQSIATQAIEKDSKSAGGYLRRAVAAGKLALFKGILESRSLVLKIKADASKVLELASANAYQKALAHYLLGRSHLKVAEKPKAMRLPIGLGWASKKKGKNHILKAVQLAPDSIPFNLFHAKILVDDGKKSEAKAILGKIKDMKVVDPADPGHQKEAVELLKTL